MIRPPQTAKIICGGFSNKEDMMKRITIGMTAHVDAGKTTLSEAILYQSGEIRSLGRVDKGNTFLDTFEIEKKRGITIFSKQAVAHFGNGEYTLLDTPGHVDFSAETERALSVLDCAVLVISGTDGVQNHTETLWRLLSRYHIPVFIFINKMDISHLERQSLLSELKARLDGNCVDMDPRREPDELFDELALCGEDMMNSFLENGTVPDEQIQSAVAERRLFPCYFGAALKQQGVAELMEGIDRYLPEPERPAEFGAKVFKITEDEQGNRLTHLKITGGSLKVKTALESGEKVNQLRIYSGTKFSTVPEVFAGTVCAAAGLTETNAGDGLGFEKNSVRPALEPVLSYKVILPPDVSVNTALVQLRKLEDEDPQLHISLNEKLNEIHLRLMGEIQLEVLKNVIAERFGYNVEFGRGSIAYKETILGIAEGVGHYEPLRHYAEVHLILSEGEPNSGLQFETNCREDILDKNWQRLILTHLEEKTHLGVLTGSPITDMKITLASGRAHLKHTEGGDFRQATYRAVRQGLRSAQSVLLEPWYDFTLEIPKECAGRALNDLQNMSAEFSSPEIIEENAVIKGSASVSEIMDYPSEVTGYSRGKGRISCEYKGYFPCHNSDEVISQIAYDCDGDLENSADSIFCSHGAGFNVKWNEVPQYMHLESALKPKKEEETVRERRPAYSGKPADDKELMEIFERTYGKIDRNPRYAMKTEKAVSTKQPKAAPMPTGPEYLLVDGYNIIFAWDDLKKIAADNLDLARSMLINALANYRGYKQNNVILVFDAYKLKGNTGSVEDASGISVVYTKEAETADMYIEKTTHQLAKNCRVRVATSDGAEQMIILGSGAFRMSAAELYEEIKMAEKAIQSMVDKLPTGGRQFHKIERKEDNNA